MQKWCIPCEVVREKAAAWLEEELSPAETDMIAEHLDRCEQCVAFVHSLEQIDLTPPKLRFTTSDDYWQSMDKVLGHEMDVQEKGGKSRPYVMWEFWALAASALFQAFINSDDPTSTFVAVLPALAVISMAWLTTIRLVLPKPDNA